MPGLNQLFHGDNLDVLRSEIAAESVDLVYLDPPFNSNRNYEVTGVRRPAFEDRWTWTRAADEQYDACTVGGPSNALGTALRSFRLLLGENDALAYLVNMAPRLVELHRVLKPTGSMFLHCDPVMSHYLKVLLDAIFGFERFQNEIIWHHGLGAMTGSSKFPSKHDVLFWYSKGKRPKFTKLRGEITPAMDRKYSHADDGGRYMMSYGKKYYLKGGKPFDDVWDVAALSPTSKERLGYPTQKPMALLERVIGASTDEGDLVLDAFCGCGTTLDAAVRLHRRWIGVDSSLLAVDLVERRLQAAHGIEIKQTYEVRTPPTCPGVRPL